MRDLVASQYEHPQFIPPYICPDLGGDRKPCAVWQDALFLIPFVLHNNYDNLSIIQTCYEPMKKYYENGIPKDKDGLWAESFQFGGKTSAILTSIYAKNYYTDWLDPDAPRGDSGKSKTNSLLVADSFLYHCVNVIATCAYRLGIIDEARHYLDVASKIQKAYYIKWVVMKPGSPSSGPILLSDTQTALALALEFNILPSNLIHTAKLRLIERVQATNYHLSTGFAGTPSLLPAISSTPLYPKSPGKDDGSEEDDAETAQGGTPLALRVLLEPHDYPSWLYPVTMGATTVWERWNSMLPDRSINPSSMTSFNHYAYGSVRKRSFIRKFL